MTPVHSSYRVLALRMTSIGRNGAGPGVPVQLIAIDATVTGVENKHKRQEEVMYQWVRGN